jgi:hypothetical protein
MKTSLKVLTILSTMAMLTGCPSSGGGGGDTTTTTGVATTGIQSNGECTPDASAAYLFIRNSQTYTDVQQIKTACANLTTLIGTQTCRITNQNLVASSTDTQYKCNVANGVSNPTTNPYPGYPNQGGYPNQPGQTIQTKNFVCNIEVSNGSAAGSVMAMPVQVFANGADLRLYANMQNTKSYLGGFFRYTKYFSSEKLAALKLKFKPGTGSAADTVTLSANLGNGKSASVSGFAGSELRIEITPDYENDTMLNVSCAGQDNFNPGLAVNGSNVKCLIREDNNGRKTSVMVLKPISEFENSEIQPIRKSNLTLTSAAANTLSTSVSPSVGYESYHLSSGLTTPTTVKIRTSGYSLDSNCSLQ